MESNHDNTVVSAPKSNVDSHKIDEQCIKHPINNEVFYALPATISVVENSTQKAVNLTIISLKEAARGSFGTVFEGILKDSKQIAVKKVLQDRRYKNRELDIMKVLHHNHITSLLYYYYSSSPNSDELYLNLVMDFVTQTLSRILKFYSKNCSYLPMNFVKIYMFQLFRGLNYIHQQQICHRDIKPQNVLIDPTKCLLRICDFGSAKKLQIQNNNVAYICSRYYRAPELIFGATNYTLAIDIWSAGCVFAEVLLNKPLFPGQTSVEQIVEIIKILGTPTDDNIRDMNPNYNNYQLPNVAPCSFDRIFSNPDIPEDAFLLLKETYQYSPRQRISALQFIAHSFFDTIRDPNFKLGSKQVIPPLFDFTDMELGNADDIIRKRLTGEKDKK